MDLTLKDLIVKPEISGPAAMKSSLRQATEAASVSAFNNLLGQTEKPSRDVASNISDTRRTNEPERTAPSYRNDASSAEAERPHRADTESTRSTSENTSEKAAPGDENNQAQAGSSDSGKSENQNTQGQDETGETDQTAAAPTESASQNAAMVGVRSAIFAEKNLSTVAAAVTSAVATATAEQGKPSGIPGHTISAAAASAAKPTTNGAKPATTNAAADNGAALGLTNVVETAGSEETSAIARMLGASKGAPAAQSQSSNAATPAASAPANTPALPETANPLAKLNVPVGITVEVARASSEPRSPLASGLLVAQEAAQQGQGGITTAQNMANNATATASNSNGSTNAAQNGFGQAGVNASVSAGDLPTPASMAAVEATGLSSAPPSTSGSNTPTHGLLGVNGQATSVLNQGPNAAASASLRTPQPVPVPLDQVAVQIARAAASGTDHISIKLKPATLGNVEVKLELTHDGRVAVVVTADRSDTLDLLQRDSRTLERALQEAGLQTDSNSLEFNLRGESGAEQNLDNPGNDNSKQAHTIAQDDVEIPPATIAGYENARGASGGVDIRV